jgi:hypothetical protein
MIDTLSFVFGALFGAGLYFIFNVLRHVETRVRLWSEKKQ